MVRWILLFFWVFSGCVTTHNYVEPRIAKTWDKYFGTCTDIDGDGQFVISSLTATSSFEMEFTGQGARSEIRVYDPLGRTVLTIKLDSKKLAVSGSLAGKLGNLKLDEEGFLIAGDEWLGLKIDEVNCLLMQKWPRAWLSYLTALDKESGGISLQVDDYKRKILLRLNNSGHSVQNLSCAELTWSKYWLFDATVNVCQSSVSRTSEINVEDLGIKWTRSPSSVNM